MIVLVASVSAKEGGFQVVLHDDGGREKALGPFATAEESNSEAIAWRELVRFREGVKAGPFSTRILLAEAGG